MVVPDVARAAILADPLASNVDLAARLGKRPQTIAAYRSRLRRLGYNLPPLPPSRPRPIDAAVEQLQRGLSLRRAAKAAGMTEKALAARINRRGLYVADVRGPWIVTFPDLARMLGYATTSPRLRRRLRAAGAPIRPSGKRRSRILVDVIEFVAWAATDAGRAAIRMERIADAELREAIEQERKQQ
jgi:hypothetical protein